MLHISCLTKLDCDQLSIMFLLVHISLCLKIKIFLTTVDFRNQKYFYIKQLICDHDSKDSYVNMKNKNKLKKLLEITYV